MKREFARIERLPPYVFNELNELKMQARRRGEDIVDFGMGNPDQPSPAHIVDKASEAIHKGPNHRYSVSRGIYKLRLAATAGDKRKWDVDLDPDAEMICTMGAKEGLGHMVLAVTGPGDVVLCPSPTYPIHQYSVIIAGGDLRHVPLIPGQDFIADLEQAIHDSWPKPKLLIISFPSNPTTEVVDLAFFERIVELARAPGRRRPRGGGGVLYTVEDLRLARMAGRFRSRQPRHDSGPGPRKVILRLRDVRADTDRRHPGSQRSAGLCGGYEGALPQAP